jgi:N-acetylmuramoyl-L-alanine amidase
MKMTRLAIFSLVLPLLIFAPLCQGGSPMTRNSVLNGKNICIDPGHGGTAQTDSFRVGRSGEREEWINLRVACYLRDMLKASGANVLMTRDDDVSVPLKDRAVLAVKNNADLFLSIHHNATADSAVNFPIVYFHGNASENKAGVMLGRCIARSVAKFLYNNKTERSLVSDHTIFPEAGAGVLRNSYGIPGVLAEASFFSNTDEELRLKDTSYNKREAKAFYSAMVEYFSHKKSGIKEKYSLVKVHPFQVYQEADRMSDTAKSWYAYYLKGKRKFKEGTAESLNEAYQLFFASAKSFPDSYVAGKCHYYLSLITKSSDKPFSDDEKKRMNEFYVMDHDNH